MASRRCHLDLPAFIAATLVATLSFPACAATTGLVVSVHDGDTLTFLVGKQQVKVRLAEIDAPELRRGRWRTAVGSAAARGVSQAQHLRPARGPNAMQ